MSEECSFNPDLRREAMNLRLDRERLLDRLGESLNTDPSDYIPPHRKEEWHIRTRIAYYAGVSVVSDGIIDSLAERSSAQAPFGISSDLQFPGLVSAAMMKQLCVDIDTKTADYRDLINPLDEVVKKLASMGVSRFGGLYHVMDAGAYTAGVAMELSLGILAQGRPQNEDIAPAIVRAGSQLPGKMADLPIRYISSFLVSLQEALKDTSPNFDPHSLIRFRRNDAGQITGISPDYTKNHEFNAAVNDTQAVRRTVGCPVRLSPTAMKKLWNMALDVPDHETPPLTGN